MDFNLLNIITNIDLIAGTCFVLGFGLVIFEMFHPGFGAPGIIGIALLFFGVYKTAGSPLEAAVMIVIILVILGIALTLVLHSATKGHLSKTMILSESLKRESGYIGTEDLEYFLGKEGISLTALRPSGSANFDGVRLDVVSEGEFIHRETRVKIIKVEGRRIVVKAI